MAKPTKQQAVSSTEDQVVTAQPGTDLDVVIDGEIIAAAERASIFVSDRGYGPNTIELVMYIASRSVDEMDLNVVIMEQLSARLLAATSPEEILQPFEPQQGKMHYGKPLWVTGSTFIESDYEGFPWYVSLSATVPATKESFVVTVGGEKVVMQAAAFERSQQWPCYLRICESEKATKAGFHPLELRPAVDI